MSELTLDMLRCDEEIMKIGTDYSKAIFGDWSSWLDGGRKCVFCGSNKNLSRVSVDAYNGFHWYYFHDSCLQKVTDDPEKYEMLIDYANEIITEIGRYNARQLKKELQKELKL